MEVGQGRESLEGLLQLGVPDLLCAGSSAGAHGHRQALCSAMGACCSVPAGGGEERQRACMGQPEVDQHELWLRKLEDLRRLLVVTATHVEPDGGGAVVPQIEEWAAAQRERAAAGERVDLMGAFESVIVAIGTSTRTMTVLKGLSQAVMLQAITFLFTQTGLLTLTNCMLADVAATWTVEIDVSQIGRVLLSHTKTQGKPSEVASLDFRVSLELEEQRGALQLVGATLQLLQLRPNPALASSGQADALVCWQQRVNAALEALSRKPLPNDLEAAELAQLGQAAMVWHQEMKVSWSELEPLRGTTAADIFRMCVVFTPLVLVVPSTLAARLHWKLTCEHGALQGSRRVCPHTGRRHSHDTCRFCWLLTHLLIPQSTDVTLASNRHPVKV